MVFLILFLSSTVAWEGYQVLAIPAPTINSICEPGACTSSTCTYYVYLDSIITNTTLIKNCQTGANDFSASTTSAALQAMFTYIATAPTPLPIPPGNLPTGPQFKIQFAAQNFYFNTKVTINVNNPNYGISLLDRKSVV